MNFLKLLYWDNLNMTPLLDSQGLWRPPFSHMEIHMPPPPPTF